MTELFTNVRLLILATGLVAPSEDLRSRLADVEDLQRPIGGRGACVASRRRTANFVVGRQHKRLSLHLYGSVNLFFSNRTMLTNVLPYHTNGAIDRGSSTIGFPRLGTPPKQRYITRL